MTTYQTPLLVGIFQDEAQAKSAVDTLRGTGFRYEQVGVAMRTGNNALHNLREDLMRLGVPQDRAAFYDQEYRSGHIVISVRPDGREQEVMNVMRSNGALNYESINSPAGIAQAPNNQPGAYPPAGMNQPAANAYPSAGMNQPAANAYPPAGTNQPAANAYSSAGTNQPAANMYPPAGTNQPGAYPPAGTNQPDTYPSAGTNQPAANAYPPTGVNQPDPTGVNPANPNAYPPAGANQPGPVVGADPTNANAHPPAGASQSGPAGVDPTNPNAYPPTGANQSPDPTNVSPAENPRQQATNVDQPVETQPSEPPAQANQPDPTRTDNYGQDDSR